jgi:glycosyltransferase involved in cell wall biosynthesis
MSELLKMGDTIFGGGAGGDGYEARIESLGISFTPIPVDKKGINPPADLKLFWTLYHWYRKEKPDIVHHFTIKPVIYGSIAARLARVSKIINTVPGLGYVFSEEGSRWLRNLVEWEYFTALAAAHYTFFQNPDDLKLFLEQGLIKPHKAGILQGSGVDLDFFSPFYGSNKTKKGKPITFLMVSRLLREKGIYEFVESARKVKEHFPEIQFQLLGQRDVRNPTVVPQKDLDQWEAEGIVRWMGEVTDVRPIIAEADVAVLPSYYREGIPRSLLEAAAMAKPIITTNAIGCREAVEDGLNGLVVPVKDVPALSQAMLYMIKHPDELKRMGEAGREKMVREFDERVVIKKILEAYDQIY